VQIVSITAAGMEIVRELEATSEHLRRAVRKGTTKEQRRQAIEPLETVRKNLLELDL